MGSGVNQNATFVKNLHMQCQEIMKKKKDAAPGRI